MNKMKIQLEDMSTKNKNFVSKNDSLIEEVKSMEEKLNHSKHNVNSLKKTIAEKDLELKKSNDKLEGLGNFTSELEKLEKKNLDHQKKHENLKREFEYYHF